MASHIKTELSPSPPLLTAFEKVPSRRCLVLSLCFGLLWSALGAGDWFMRFYWFGWQRTLVLRSAVSPAATQQASITTNALSRGGDLSRLIGIPSVAATFEEVRPGATNYTDTFGFRNQGPILDHYPVVCVGDSYAASGPRFEDSLPAQLSSALGLPVYNHAIAGRGTFWAAVRFFASERFRGREPRVLVWPIIEREISGGYFAGGLFQVSVATSNASPKSSTVAWSQLQPSTLKWSLPNTSAYSQFSGKSWNRVRYLLFDQLNPSVVAAMHPVCNGPLLFFSEAVESARWSDETRDLDRVISATSRIAAMARSRGMTLLFVLVPDKERVYSEALPQAAQIGMRPSVLPDIESRMRKEGLSVVNLLPAFDSAAANSEMLFWRDDTHWNPQGVRLAATVIAPEVKRLLASP